jgi:hypothetical protein
MYTASGCGLIVPQAVYAVTYLEVRIIDGRHELGHHPLHLCECLWPRVHLKLQHEQ